MHVSQTGVFETFVAVTTILTIREENLFTRVLSFRNVSGGVLSIVIDASVDGGVTWVTDTATFPLADGVVISKVPVSSNLLRVRASLTAADHGLEISYSRIEADSVAGVWMSPQI